MLLTATLFAAHYTPLYGIPLSSHTNNSHLKLAFLLSLFIIFIFSIIFLILRLKISVLGAGTLAQQVQPVPAMPAFYMETVGLNLICSTSDPAPCQWLRKREEDGSSVWNSAPLWKTWKKLLFSVQPSSGHCGI